FKLQQPAQNIIGQSSVDIRQLILKSVKNADAFASKIEKAELEKIIIREYEVELNDGVVLLIDYVPVFVDTIFHGHLWMFRDVTDIKHLEKQN
ncbi:hypothetical protein ABTN33_19395, partial [Acinetobacter baumannii]